MLRPCMMWPRQASPSATPPTLPLTSCAPATRGLQMDYWDQTDYSFAEVREYNSGRNTWEMEILYELYVIRNVTAYKILKYKVQSRIAAPEPSGTLPQALLPRSSQQTECSTLDLMSSLSAVNSFFIASFSKALFSCWAASSFPSRSACLSSSFFSCSVWIKACQKESDGSLEFRKITGKWDNEA